MAREAFVRRIDIKAKDEGAATFYIGDSPSFKHVYARNAADGNVYNVEFSVYDAPAAVNDWVDRDTLHIARDQVSRIALGPIALVRNDDAFVLEGLSGDETTNAEEVERLAETVLELSFDEVEPPRDGAPNFASPELELVISMTDGRSRAYRFVEGEGETASDYVFRSSDHEQLFRIGKHRIEALLEADRAMLVRKTSTEERADEAAAQTDNGDADEDA